VEDLDAAEQFYGQVLGLELVTRQSELHCFFRCGGGMLLLFRPEVSEQSDGEIPAHGARGPGHVAFAAHPDELLAWRVWLRTKQVPIDREVEWPNGARSIYFRDPAGNSLELATPSLWNF
jgi:catechol 2,3-dioxygenase-like lactoylglutathione lyase family enzyme